jgi:spore germination protein KA
MAGHKDKKNEAAAGDISSDSLRTMFAESQDIVFGEIAANRKREIILTYAFVDGMVDSKILDDDILRPLVQEESLEDTKTDEQLLELIMQGSVYHCQRTLRDKLSDCIEDLLSGSVILIFNGAKKAVSFEAKGFSKRSIEEPTNQNVIKGSKEGFIEVLRVNTALVRRRIKAHDLIMHHINIGERTNTAVCVTYIKSIANDMIVNGVIRCLSDKATDGIITAGHIESFLNQRKWSIFPHIINTERVDKFCSNILEGRVGILVDGLPIGFITPVNYISFIHAPEDYSFVYTQSVFIRMVRIVAMLVSVIVPGFYVSIITFHQEMIPTKLASSIISSEEAVPFNTYIEVLLMLLAFEVLLEAGLRLPKAVGQAVSIVGALVVGEAAITANMLSPGVVIVVAASGITGFVIPSQDLSNADRICRLFLVLCSIVSGLYGVAVGIILIVYHLCSIEAFGVPYVSPFAANEGKQLLNDTFIRFPWLKKRIDRPTNIKPKDVQRQNIK